MDMELHNELEPEYTPSSSPNPRRRKKTKLQVFKEAYLPLIIVAFTFVLVVVFIIGGIRGNDSADTTSNSTNPSTQPSSSTTNSTVPPETMELQAEAEALMAQAAALLPDYDYAGALAILDTFSGDMALFPELSAVYAQYQAELDSMVEWTGSQVVNLSFQLLIADPERAFQDATYSKQYRNNFITVTEFSAILQQLYDNDYILVSLSDLYESVHDESSDRDIWVAKTLLLPPGKTPVMLTETNANYYAYMVDPDKNGTPDANAAGFAYKLCYDGQEGFYNELVLADGTVVKGAYDMVPLLEAFIAKHPDFSYRDARAIIAFSGYDGVLGYRLYSSKLTPAQQLEEQAAAAAVVNALRETGYDIACFTYGNSNKGTLNYGELDPEAILADLQLWKEKITPVIGETNIFVFAKEDDIAGEESYIGNAKFNAMHNENYGNFDFFLSTGTAPWDQVDKEYVRHNRLMVTGAYLQKYPERFAELFDPAAVLDPYRENFN